MVRSTRIGLMLFGCLMLAWPARVLGQMLPPPPPPCPVYLQDPAVLPQMIMVPQPGQPQAVWQPPPSPDSPPPVFPPVLIQTPGDPLIYRPAQEPGFFAAFELSVLGPALGGNLAAPVHIGGGTSTVALPFADMDWTGSPRLELGYRLPGGIGSIIADYRSVVSQGSANLDGFDPAGTAYLRTRLNLNAVDVSYLSPEHKLTTLWDWQWDAGLRLGAAYYDSKATGPTRAQSVSNNFIGVGPRVGLDVRRHLEGAPGISLFGRLETGLLFGEDTQSYGETRQLFNGTQLGGSSRFSAGQTAPMFGLQLGISYSPPENPNWYRFSFGYEFEQWWNVGGAGNSTGDVQFQGIFFRGEFHY